MPAGARMQSEEMIKARKEEEVVEVLTGNSECQNAHWLENPCDLGDDLPNILNMFQGAIGQYTIESAVRIREGSCISDAQDIQGFFFCCDSDCILVQIAPRDHYISQQYPCKMACAAR
jgi:hypothetical protein